LEGGSGLPCREKCITGQAHAKMQQFEQHGRFRDCEPLADCEKGDLLGKLGSDHKGLTCGAVEFRLEPEVQARDGIPLQKA
jgi:hypothetical protein